MKPITLIPFVFLTALLGSAFAGTTSAKAQQKQTSSATIATFPENISERFVVGSGMESDCITDKNSGLMWVKNLATVNHGAVASSWKDAQNIVHNGTWCGHSNWRLPSRNELNALVTEGRVNAIDWLEQQGFSQLQVGSYWSSTTDSKHSNVIWDMYLLDAHDYLNAQIDDVYYVWPVRSDK